MSAEPAGVRPGDAQAFETGAYGALVLIVGTVGCAVLAATGYESPLFAYRYLWVVLATLLVMATYEFGVEKVHRRNFDFGRPREWSEASTLRVLSRCGALGVHLGLAVTAYTVLTHYGLNLSPRHFLTYEGSWYAPFFRAFFPLCGGALVLAPAYAWLSERYGRWSPEEDDLLHAARGYAALLRREPPDSAFWAAQRAAFVKFYFIPVMIVFLAGNLTNFELAIRRVLLYGGPWTFDASFLSLLWDVGFNGTYVLDVALAILGYLVAFRIFDTHIRSADPSLSGWAVALACYPPLNQLVDQYLGYRSAEHSWTTSLAGSPALLVALGGVALALALVYALATVAFGLRFSNMTNRGIVSRGPYAYVRHPAYVTKVLGWWLISAPFLTGLGNTVRLGLWSALYVARALTEERHLASDPEYRAYMERVRWRFIPGIW